jgi:hypothetical protein
MKMIHSTSKKSRYEVDVMIITPYKRHTYGNSGWDLSKIFDEMSESLNRSFAEDKQRGNIRKSSRHG